MNRHAKRGAILALVLVLAGGCSAGGEAPRTVQTVPVPEGGVLPDAQVGADGRVHLVYVARDELRYSVSADGGAFAASRTLNDRPGFAAAGLFRGPELALDASGTAHVTWYNRAFPLGLERREYGYMYSRVAADGSVAPAVNVSAGPVDGQSIASLAAGPVFAWHTDDEIVVARPGPAGLPTLARQRVPGLPCECCDTALVVRDGIAYVLYRDREANRRDFYLARLDLATGATARVRVDRESWVLEGCPMSGAALHVVDGVAHAAWEHDGAVLYTTVELRTLQAAPPRQLGEGKYPLLLANGRTLLAAWKEGRRLRWQVFDAGTARTLEAGDRETGNRDRTAGYVTDGRFVLFR